MDTSYIDLLVDNLFVLLLFFAAPWVLLSLLGALGDAGVGYIDEWLLKKISRAEGTSIDAPGRLVLISGFFGVVVFFGAAAVSLFTDEQYTLNVSGHSMGLAIAAGILEVIWFVPYFNALHRGGAINATPLFQTIPIFSLILGLLIFDEHPEPIHIVATFIIVCGASLLNYSPKTKNLDLKTIFLMLSASALISIHYFLFKSATESGNFLATVFGNGVGMTIMSVLIMIFWKPYRDQFNDFLRNLDLNVLVLQTSNEGLYAVSTLASQAAVVIGPSVMIVSAFNAFHPIFTIIIGWILAKSGSKDHASSLDGAQLFTKSIAIVLIAVGTGLIAF